MILATGKIVDALSGEPLAGASVVLKDLPSVGTAADSEGKFALGDADIDDPFSVVVISMVGYNSIEYSIDELPARVLMAKTGNALAEAIVTAHKTTRKKGFWPFLIITSIVVVLIVKYKSVLKWSTPMCVLLLIHSCSPVKKVNKDESKQLKVIASYTQKHAFKNDTVYSTKSDTITMSDLKYDTVIIEKPGQIRTVDRVITKTITVNKTIHDTTLMKVTDRALEEALRQMVSEKDVDINTRDMEIQKQKTEVETYKRRAQRWFMFFIALLSLNSLYIFFKIKRVI